MHSNLFNIITVGFAIFAMFFGAGNLVYPIYIGTISNYYLSTLGLTLTGVVLPFFGLVSITLHEGKVRSFFGGLKSYVSLPLIIIILALIGPIGAIPRCIIISFGSFKPLLENANLFLFNLIFCVTLLISVWHKGKVVEILGKWLTPILILGITVIVICALLSSNEMPTHSVNDYSAFFIGMMEGYHTMDLCAAIFFGSIACDHMKNTLGDKNMISNGIPAFTLGLFLLFLVYAAFVYIGGKYGASLSEIPREQMLIIIAKKTVGKFASPVVALTVLIACLTTAMALVDLIATWLADEFKILKRSHAIICTIILSFIFALLGFTKLTGLLSTALFFLYPALIAITIANIIDYLFNTRTVNPSFWVVFIINLMYNLPFNG